MHVKLMCLRVHKSGRAAAVRPADVWQRADVENVLNNWLVFNCSANKCVLRACAYKTYNVLYKPWPRHKGGNYLLHLHRKLPHPLREDAAGKHGVIEQSSSRVPFYLRVYKWPCTYCTVLCFTYHTLFFQNTQLDQDFVHQRG